MKKQLISFKLMNPFILGLKLLLRANEVQPAVTRGGEASWGQSLALVPLLIIIFVVRAIGVEPARGITPYNNSIIWHVLLYVPLCWGASTRGASTRGLPLGGYH